MNALSVSKSCIFVFTILVAQLGQAALIYTQTPQGGYSDNVLGGSQWSTFTGMVTAQHTYTEGADFSSIVNLQAHDAVWVDQENGNTLGGGEIASLNRYTAGGGRLVLIGENSGWNSWNTSLMSIVGGSFVGTCSSAAGAPLVSNSLTAGITTVENVCGSTIGAAGSPTILFDNNFAALFSVGSGEVLVILDSNWNDNRYIGLSDNAVFAQNVVTWLGEGSGGVEPTPTPTPATLALFGLGLAGLGWSRRKKA